MESIPSWKGLAVALWLSCAGVLAQTSQPTEVRLWPGDAPGALGHAAKDIPTITVYRPGREIATGAAMVICPGGGYGRLSPHEGVDYGRWLNEQGITACVLKYRHAGDGYHYPCMMQDAARAMRVVRANASEWQLDPHRVGIMGSSAGGHLASTLLTHFDAGMADALDPIERESSRPDLGILCYAVTTLGEKTHGGSKKNLLGDNPAPGLVQELSSVLHVTKDTPPCFIWHTFEDKAVPMENSLEFAAALGKAGVPFELHIYQTGHHGMGLGGVPYNPANWLPWTGDCRHWLKEHKFGMK